MDVPPAESKKVISGRVVIDFQEWIINDSPSYIKIEAIFLSTSFNEIFGLGC